MVLLPIDIAETKNSRFLQLPECVSVLEVYRLYYGKIGFHKPWIGYFASTDGKRVVGAAGFKGKPRDGKVEIAYGTFKAHEGKGSGTQICRMLVLLAIRTDPRIKITARWTDMLLWQSSGRMALSAWASSMMRKTGTYMSGNT